MILYSFKAVPLLKSQYHHPYSSVGWRCVTQFFLEDGEWILKTFSRIWSGVYYTAFADGSRSYQNSSAARSSLCFQTRTYGFLLLLWWRWTYFINLLGNVIVLMPFMVLICWSNLRELKEFYLSTECASLLGFRESHKNASSYICIACTFRNHPLLFNLQDTWAYHCQNSHAMMNSVGSILCTLFYLSNGKTSFGPDKWSKARRSLKKKMKKIRYIGLLKVHGLLKTKFTIRLNKNEMKKAVKIYSQTRDIHGSMLLRL